MNDEKILNMHDSDSRSEGTANKEASHDALKKDKDDLLWVAHFNIALNEDAERYYCFCDSACRIITALFGTYAFSSIFIGLNLVYSIFGLVAAFVSALILVFDFKDKQVRAKVQRNRYYDVLAEVQSTSNNDNLVFIRKELSEIAKDDLPTGQICDALACNEAIDRMGLDVTYKAKVGLLKRLTRFILPWGRPKYGHRD